MPVAPLQSAGYDKPSALVSATAADLKTIGIKGGHAKRLLKLVVAAGDIQTAAASFKEAAAAAGMQVGVPVSAPNLSLRSSLSLRHCL